MTTDPSNRTYATVKARRKGMGPGSAGQSGDTQGLSDSAEADSESVVELLQEGQAFEAEAVRGVQNAEDPDVSEVHTTEDVAAPARTAGPRSKKP